MMLHWNSFVFVALNYYDYYFLLYNTDLFSCQMALVYDIWTCRCVTAAIPQCSKASVLPCASIYLHKINKLLVLQ